MTEHASIPCPCDACLQAFLNTLHKEGEYLAIFHCRHNHTLVRATIRKGIVKHWVIDAPCTAAAAAEAVKHEKNKLRAAGMLLPDTVN